MSDPELLAHARAGREHAYAPYSRFQVGAAVRCRDGRIFTGCNIENASYGLCNCAERSALFAAMAAGYRRGEFTALAVIGDTSQPISPCGACRQVLAELCPPEMPVWQANLVGAVASTTVAELLPGAFQLEQP